MKAYPISENLKDLICEEQNLRLANGEYWKMFRPIGDTGYKGLAHCNLEAVLNVIIRQLHSLKRKGFTPDSQPIQRNKEMFQEVTDLFFQ